MSKQVSAGLFGLGNIGLKYDLNSKLSSDIKTHAKALFKFDEIDFKFAVDPDQQNRKDFENNYGIKSYPIINDVLNPGVDLAVIATPTSTRLTDIENVIKMCHPQYLILEKPIAANAQDAKVIINLASKNNILVLLNYHRRFLPGVASLKEMIDSLQYGHLNEITCQYNRGLINCGSHFIDLIFYLLGEHYSNLKVTKKIESPHYPNYSFQYNVNKTSVTFTGLTQNEFNVGDLTFYFEKATVKINNHLNEIQILENNQGQIHTRVIGLETNNFIFHTYQHLLNSIQNKSPFNSNLNSALFTLNFCEEIIHGLV